MSDAYEITLSVDAAKSIRKLPKQVQRAVVAALTALETDPRAGMPLIGELARIWSLRRGDYRVLYRIEDGERRVSIARVGHRRDVYRRR
jgi:mRNA-degrading endonuclease RelE of RelBE toxin-antitoxin system